MTLNATFSRRCRRRGGSRISSSAISRKRARSCRSTSGPTSEWSAEAYFEEGEAGCDRGAAARLARRRCFPRAAAGRGAAGDGLDCGRPEGAGAGRRRPLRGPRQPRPRVGCRAGRIAIEIEAGQAFGTGHHGTTAGCFAVLDRLAAMRPLPDASSISAPAPACSPSRWPRRCGGRCSRRDIDPVACARARERRAQRRRATGARGDRGRAAHPAIADAGALRSHRRQHPRRAADAPCAAVVARSSRRAAILSSRGSSGQRERVTAAYGAQGMRLAGCGVRRLDGAAPREIRAAARAPGASRSAARRGRVAARSLMLQSRPAAAEQPRPVMLPRTEEPAMFQNFEEPPTPRKGAERVARLRAELRAARRSTASSCRAPTSTRANTCRPPPSGSPG